MVTPIIPGGLREENILSTWPFDTVWSRW